MADSRSDIERLMRAARGLPAHKAHKVLDANSRYGRFGGNWGKRDAISSWLGLSSRSPEDVTRLQFDLLEAAQIHLIERQAQKERKQQEVERASYALDAASASQTPEDLDDWDDLLDEQEAQINKRISEDQRQLQDLQDLRRDNRILRLYKRGKKDRVAHYLSQGTWPRSAWWKRQLGI